MQARRARHLVRQQGGLPIRSSTASSPALRQRPRHVAAMQISGAEEEIIGNVENIRNKSAEYIASKLEFDDFLGKVDLIPGAQLTIDVMAVFDGTQPNTKTLKLIGISEGFVDVMGWTPQEVYSWSSFIFCTSTDPEHLQHNLELAAKYLAVIENPDSKDVFTGVPIPRNASGAAVARLNVAVPIVVGGYHMVADVGVFFPMGIDKAQEFARNPVIVKQLAAIATYAKTSLYAREWMLGVLRGFCTKYLAGSLSDMRFNSTNMERGCRQHIRSLYGFVHLKSDNPDFYNEYCVDPNAKIRPRSKSVGAAASGRQLLDIDPLRQTSRMEQYKTIALAAASAKTLPSMDSFSADVSVVGSGVSAIDSGATDLISSGAVIDGSGDSVGNLSDVEEPPLSKRKQKKIRRYNNNNNNNRKAEQKSRKKEKSRNRRKAYLKRKRERKRAEAIARGEQPRESTFNTGKADATKS